MIEGLAQEEGGLGEIGGDEIGFGGELDHLLAHLRGVGAVDPAVVAHNGVDEDQSLPLTEPSDQAAEHINLLQRAEKTGVNGVKGGVEGLPV